MRIGAKKRPFYRVVVVDERSKRNGAYLELLGTYNPLTTPHDIKLKKDRIDYWLKQGAQKSDGFLRIIGEAPKRPPRKPKKEKTIQKDSENSVKPEDQKASESESPQEQATDTTETPTPSDTPSPSESLKKEPEK